MTGCACPKAGIAVIALRTLLELEVGVEALPRELVRGLRGRGPAPPRSN